jgi:hypothetical protein
MGFNSAFKVLMKLEFLHRFWKNVNFMIISAVRGDMTKLIVALLAILLTRVKRQEKTTNG